MQTTTLNPNDIQVIDRLRSEMGDLSGLADSIRRCGVLQPILVTQDKRLVVGGRRLAACKLLELKEIPVIYRESMTEDELHEYDIESNKHKRFEWWEEALGIAHICLLRQRRYALEGKSWGVREASADLDISTGKISYSVALAKWLNHSDSTIAKSFRDCDNMQEAWRLRLRIEQDKANEILSQKAKRQVNTPAQQAVIAKTIEIVEAVEAKPDLLAFERQRYEKNPLNVVPFDQYWTEKTKEVEEARNTLFISNHFVFGDSIAYMNDRQNFRMFDHVITDIPYGIDMDMLDQDNQSMADIDTVEEEHDEAENLKLIESFYPAAVACTKPNAFIVTWCDIMLWQRMYDLATASGLVVQRWPIVWVKTNTCKNSAAGYNYTKRTEIAIVARKEGATLMKTASDNVVVASNAEMKKITGHPFAKPFECWQRIIDHVSLEGQTILEPFAGRGSGVLSALRLKRNCIAVEKNAAHFNHLLEVIKTHHYLKINPKYVFK